MSQVAAESNNSKERGTGGILGKGTTGRRLKRSCPDGMSLKAFARHVWAIYKHPLKADAGKWLASKVGQ